MPRTVVGLAVVLLTLQGCVLRSRFDAPRWSTSQDASTTHQEINVSQPSVCNNYPVEYRREVPSDDGKQVIVRAAVLTKVPSRCDARKNEVTSNRRSAWWRLW